MNAISYINGDADPATCPTAYGPFARAAQMINDRLCGTAGSDKGGPPRGCATTRKLCANCAHQVWMMGIP
jgi:hypothetical protein